ncbi:hypothetical protein [Rhodospirillum centenum]|uniref:Uncharacterized protein n=1 Tax=Rhodospirillum centenum (strain ATCC 51521 / SW) TaxID=414684 RepID=B6ITT0_RHOCS|nr:hypothetical protein [Rhodospirillum centenum]ACI99466.1 hypothetical protein RC1_2076 [Rhodospirillum centenum SW]
MSEPVPEKHPLADAARTLFKELTEAGRPVVGVGMGEGRIILRISAPDHGAPEEYRGYPVIILTDEGIRR